MPLTTTIMIMYPAPSAAAITTTATNTVTKTHFELFVSTRSRVIRVFDIPRGELGNGLLLSLLSNNGLLLTASAVSLWTLREEWGGRPIGEEESVWVAFRSHEQAFMALRMISGGNNATAAAAGGAFMLSAATALESDLEPSIKLRKVELRRNSIPFRQVHSANDLRAHFYTCSSNPPPPPRNLTTTVNGTTSNNNSNVAFRQGDWMCICNAHNFMRNTLCIACSSPRHLLPQTFTVSPSSSSVSITSSNLNNSNSNSNSNNTKLPIIFTPSGRALAVGGKVQNVSGDPMAPCIIFWPDNEPFPEQRQIRPTFQFGALPGAQPPPILNTGNKGPIEQQPGDWICGKCEYLNWRRRKVCQTCYPYAEGNADGVSPAVQAERLAILTQVLGICAQPTTTTLQMQVQMSPAPSNSSTCTSTSTSTSTTGSVYSPRSSPSTTSTSIFSVPLSSPKKIDCDALDVVAYRRRPHQYQYQYQHHQYSHPPRNPSTHPHGIIVPPYLTEEQDREQKDMEYFSPLVVTRNTKPNLNLALPPTTMAAVAPGIGLGVPALPALAAATTFSSGSSPTSTIIRRQSSLTFTPGHHQSSPTPTSTSIWTMDEEELETGLGLGLGLGL